jgi:hypothetical protein
LGDVLVERDSNGDIYVNEPTGQKQPVNLAYWEKTFGVSNKKNFIANETNNVISGVYNFVTGNTNQITSGNGNIIGGYNNILNGTYVSIFGNKHLIYGDQNFTVGTENSIGYDANKNPSQKSSYNVVGGRSNKVGQTKKVWDVAVFGQNNVVNNTGVLAVGANHTSSRDYQTLLGNGAKADVDALLIVANNGLNIFTVGKGGTRSDVDTDAVTVKYLKNYINEVFKNFPIAEEASF